MKITTNSFYDICTHISNRAESKLKEFDEHLTFDEERQKVFLEGVMYTSAILGKAYYTGKPTPIIYDYEKYLELYNLFEKETKPEKAHQISMEEYLEEKNKEGNVNDLAKQVASIIMEQFKDKYSKKDK